MKEKCNLPLLRVEGSPECPECLEGLPTGVLTAGLWVYLDREQGDWGGLLDKAGHRFNRRMVKRLRVKRHMIKRLRVRVWVKRHMA